MTLRWAASGIDLSAAITLASSWFFWQKSSTSLRWSPQPKSPRDWSLRGDSPIGLPAPLLPPRLPHLTAPRLTGLLLFLLRLLTGPGPGPQLRPRLWQCVRRRRRRRFVWWFRAGPSSLSDEELEPLSAPSA